MFMNKLLLVEKIINKIESAYEDIHSDYRKMSGGDQRSWSGNLVEDTVRELLSEFCSEYYFEIFPSQLIKGESDGLVLHNSGGFIKVKLDWHLYIKDRLALVIECKSYLDSSFLNRAVNSTSLIRRSVGYNVPSIVVALEKALSDDALNFWLAEREVDDVFFLMDGARKSSEPIYKPEYRKDVNAGVLHALVDKLYNIIRGNMESAGIERYL